MRTPFSIKHKKIIEQGKLVVSFNKRHRTKIIMLLEDVSEWQTFYTNTGYNYNETAFQSVYNELTRAYGYRKLIVFSGNETKETEKLEEYLLEAKVENFIDALEFWYDSLREVNAKNSFIAKLNAIFKIDEIPLRFIDESIVRLDSEFAQSEILSHSNRLLKNHSFEKALHDFQDARSRLSQGDYSGCIISANNSLESYLKKLLNNKNGNQGGLKKALVRSKLIPDYFQGFLEHFEALLQSSFTIANKSRHGQIEMPNEKNEVNEAVASFCLNLVGSLIVFITERYIETLPKEDAVSVEAEKEDVSKEREDLDDLPF